MINWKIAAVVDIVVMVVIVGMFSWQQGQINALKKALADDITLSENLIQIFENNL